MRVILDVRNTQPIQGQVKADLNIIRTVSGLALPIRCYMTNFGPFGSCIYEDLCTVLKWALNFDENNCPDSFIENEFYCDCPFRLPAKELNIDQEFDIPDMATTAFSFFASGNFDFTVKASIGSMNMLCLNMKYTVRPK